MEKIHDRTTEKTFCYCEHCGRFLGIYKDIDDWIYCPYCAGELYHLITSKEK